METTLELSMLARIFQHKYAIIGAYLMEKNKAQIDSVPNTIHEYLENGLFDTKYLEAYEAIKDRIPDNYSTCM